LKYQRVPQNLLQMKACLAAGSPIVLGFSVYTAFEGSLVAKTGVLNMPQKGEKLLGGHAVLCVGYVDKDKRFIVRNSWGTDWGQDGYFTIPYDYFVTGSLADDLWTISQVS
jgi:C1A family cysteine protease